MKYACTYKLYGASQVHTSVEKLKDTYVAQIEVAASSSLDDKEVYVSWCVNLLGRLSKKTSICTRLVACIQQSCVDIANAHAGFSAQQ